MKFLAGLWHFLVKNISYKIMALLITALIWLLVLGRGHQTEDINLKVEFAGLVSGLEITEASYHVVKVKVKGPPKLIRKFILENDALVLGQLIDHPGIRRIRVRPKSLILPNGLRVLSMTPREIRLVVRSNEEKGK